MSDDEKTKAREARLKKGIQSRIKSISTLKQDSDTEDKETNAPVGGDPKSQISTIRQVPFLPQSLLKAATIKRVATTQRDEYYAVSRNKLRRVEISPEVTVRTIKGTGADSSKEGPKEI